MSEQDDLHEPVEKGLRLFAEWPEAHLSLQDTAFPKEALCSICYLSGLGRWKAADMIAYKGGKPVRCLA